jgi:iron complex outermembrane receptor protein
MKRFKTEGSMKYNFGATAIAVGLLSLASGAYAQNTEPSSAGAAAGPPTESGLDEIIVTAQRRKERLQDVPLTVSAFSSNDLANAGVYSVRDLQNLVPGFIFSQFGTNPQPAIRGVSTTLSDVGAENPVALYIDGVYHGPAAILLNEFNDIDNVEVLKGPQGTLFGRNATGGAIQIVTKGPSFDPQFDITYEQGYYTGSGASHTAFHENAEAFVTGPIVPNLVAGSLSGGYSWTPGFFTNAVTGDSEGEIAKGGFRGKVLVTPADGLKITLEGYYIRNNEAGLITYSAFDGLSAGAQYPGTAVASRPWTTLPGDDITNSFATMKGESAKVDFETPAGLFTSISAYNYFRDPGAIQSLSAAAGPNTCFLTLACLNYNTITITKEISQEFDFASKDFGIFRFTSGLYYYKGWGLVSGYIQQNYFPPNGILAQNDSVDNKSYAAYTEGTVKPTDDLSIILGLRYTIEPTEGDLLLPGEFHQGKQTFDSTTPRVSVTYKLTPTLNAYVTYSQGFKSGNAGANNAAAPIPFTPVKPEKLSAYETGLKFASSDLTANLAAYYYDYTNKQEQVFFGTSYYFSNTGPVEIYGLDADTTFRLNHQFSVRSALSWIPTAKYKDFPNAGGQSTTTVPFLPGGGCAPFGGCGEYGSLIFDATGKRLIRTPKWSASTTISYEDEVAGGHFDASSTLAYTTSVGLESTDTVTQGGYASLEAQAGYRFKDSNLRLGLYGRNLTNKAFLTGQLVSASGFLANYGPPREIGISINYAH